MKLRKLAVIGSFIVLGLALSGCNLYKTGQNNSTAQDQSSPSAVSEDATDSVTINYTDSGFEPKQSAVKSGGKIIWTNNSSKEVQVGSAQHPTHTVNQEITGNQFVITLAPGESQTVTVTKVGDWGFHNHLNAGNSGKVSVK